MALVKVGSVAALAPNAVTEVFVDDQPYAICNIDGTVRAMSGVCLHAGGPLGQGQVRDGLVVCPFHLWEFDAATGACPFTPARRVPTFDVRLDGDEIWIEVP